MKRYKAVLQCSSSTAQKFQVARVGRLLVPRSQKWRAPLFLQHSIPYRSISLHCALRSSAPSIIFSQNLPFAFFKNLLIDKMEGQSKKDPESVYDFIVKDAKGSDVDLSIYKSKVLLVVNVASKCGLTKSNYTELNQLYEKYKDQGLEILAFPCNQFGEEEPGTNDQILEFVCTHFKSEYPVFDKIEVNGENAAPLYKFLKLGKWGIIGDDIQWNFAKFLVDMNGQAVDRYYPTTSPLTIERDIQKLLGIL